MFSTTSPAASAASSGSKCRRGPSSLSSAHTPMSTIVTSRRTWRRYRAKSAPTIAPNANDPMISHRSRASRLTSVAVAAPDDQRTNCIAIENRMMSARSVMTTTASTISLSGPRARVSAITAIVTVGEKLTMTVVSRMVSASRVTPAASG